MGHFIGKREPEDDGEQGCPGNEKVFNWCQALPHRQGLDCINSITTSNLFQEGGEPQVAATRQGGWAWRMCRGPCCWIVPPLRCGPSFPGGPQPRV